jgi:hypothetical protein
LKVLSKFLNASGTQEAADPASVTCKAEELSAMTFAASLNALEAFCSPSAAIT